MRKHTDDLGKQAEGCVNIAANRFCVFMWRNADNREREYRICAVSAFESCFFFFFFAMVTTEDKPLMLVATFACRTTILPTTNGLIGPQQSELIEILCQIGFLIGMFYVYKYTCRRIRTKKRGKFEEDKVYLTSFITGLITKWGLCTLMSWQALLQHTLTDDSQD